MRLSTFFSHFQHASEPPVESERERIIRDAYETGNYQTLAMRMLRYDAERRRKDEPVSYVACLPRWEEQEEF
jgi:hypothetical protein